MRTRLCIIKTAVWRSPNTHDLRSAQSQTSGGLAISRPNADLAAACTPVLMRPRTIRICVINQLFHTVPIHVICIRHNHRQESWPNVGLATECVVLDALKLLSISYDYEWNVWHWTRNWALSSGIRTNERPMIIETAIHNYVGIIMAIMPPIRC